MLNSLPQTTEVELARFQDLPVDQVALCHDWLTGMRGGERVLEWMADAFPQAVIHTLLHRSGAVSERIEGHEIRTSFLQRAPSVHKRYRYLLPLMPMAISRLHAGEVDLLVSTSHCVAKALPHADRTAHLCYCFTPMRYAWLFSEEYFGNNPVKRRLLEPLMAGLRKWDRRTAAGVDHFVAISHHVKGRIERFYGREASVVYPPVQASYYQPSGTDPEDFDLVVSALVPYKRVDLAIRAYNQMGRRLVVVGAGTEYDRLRALAGPTVTLPGRLSDAEVRDLLQRCRCLVFPGEEDFGIVPLEAMACGRPVVAFGVGGVTETVVAEETGVFFDQPTEASLVAAVRRSQEIDWDPRVIRARAEQFDVPVFLRGMREAMAACLDTHRRGGPA